MKLKNDLNQSRNASKQPTDLQIVAPGRALTDADLDQVAGGRTDGGFVSPDLALSDVKAEDYSTIVFVGGYGAASYQYANETTYDNPAY